LSCFLEERSESEADAITDLLQFLSEATLFDLIIISCANLHHREWLFSQFHFHFCKSVDDLLGYFDALALAFDNIAG
jgi:hypothetical protein